jgi:hypothetical protein
MNSPQSQGSEAVQSQGSEAVQKGKWAVQSRVFWTTVPPGEIGGLIGRKGCGVKKCIANSWRMYEKFQSSDKKIEEEKPTLRIVFQNGTEDDPTNVAVEIFSESETMLSLASLSVNKHTTEHGNNKRLSSYSIVVEYPHNLIGTFIGKGFKNVNKILSTAIFGVDENANETLIDEEDVETAQTARMNVYPNSRRPYPQFDNIKTTKDLMAFVKQRPETSFLGWPPEETDEFTEYIMITISFHRDAKPFKDREVYIEQIRGAINDSVQDIKSRNDEEMDEINGHLGF